MRNIIFTCLGLSLFSASIGQQVNKIVVSGNFINAPFKEFVSEIEKTTSLKFYYQPNLVQNITISFSGTDTDLIKVLNDPLKKAGLQLFIEDNSIYIYQGSRIVTELPDYLPSWVNQNSNDSLKKITDSEKRYLEGKVSSSIEVLEIGDKLKANSGSKCVINGRIIDESNSEPLVGAVVFINELKKGTVADIDGRFKLTLEPGKYKAVFTYASKKQQECYLQVYSSGSVTIEMKNNLILLDEVNVTANHHDNVRGMQMGYEKISIKEMKEIPLAFGERDVLKVAQMLPGVLNVGEGTSGLSIRGSGEDQNMFYIDKIPIYNTSHLLGFFTSFNPDIINDFTLYKSNIPAKYGGRLSSVFDISTRPGNKRKFFCQGGISPITAHSSFEIPVIKDKLSIVTSFRSSYSDWILKKIRDPDIRKSSAFFYDGTFSVNADINDKNLLKAFVYSSRDKFSLSSLSDYDYSNRGSSLIWEHQFSPLFLADVSVIYSSYSFENVNKIDLSTAYTQNYQINQYETRADFSLSSIANHKIEFGTSSIYYNLDRGNISPFGNVSNSRPFNFGKEAGLENALYLSDEFPLLTDFKASVGLRYSIYAILGPSVVYRYTSDVKSIYNIKDSSVYKSGEVIKTYHGTEYRLALNYSLGANSSLKASYNRLYQYIFMLSNTISISPNDKWKLCDYNIVPPRADQVSIGYYQNFDNNAMNASLEVYHKWVKNLVEYKDGTDFTSTDPIETMVLQGRQRAYGIELMITKSTGKTTGWISYCYSRSLIQVKSNISENNINNGLEYPANYDRPHSFNLVLNYKTNRRLSVATNFVYTTGRPITYPVSVYYSGTQPLFYFSRRNEFRIPDYIRMDVSAKLEGNLNRQKFVHSSWSFDVYNLLGRKNAYSVYFDSKDGRVNGHQLSIFGIPIVTISWNYKFGNYLNN